MKLNIYFDGFNFYHGAVRRTPYKWCNLRTLCELHFPSDEINKIRYFTARVKARPHDPHQPLRQDAYFRALWTVSELYIHEGMFRDREKFVRLKASGKRREQGATALVTEEKGSDVNLATYLLLDGFKKDYDAAVVVSDDSDLIEPIRAVRKDLGLRVGILNPRPPIDPVTGKARRRRELEIAVTSGFYKHVDPAHVAASLFPDEIELADGTKIIKPSGW